MANERFVGIKDVDLVLMRHKALTGTLNEDKEFIKAIDEELSERHKPSPPAQGLMGVLKKLRREGCGFKDCDNCDVLVNCIIDYIKPVIAEIVALLPEGYCKHDDSFEMDDIDRGFNRAIVLTKQHLEGKV